MLLLQTKIFFQKKVLLRKNKEEQPHNDEYLRGV